MSRAREVATCVWIQLLEAYRSRIALPLVAALLLATALCTSIDLASELGLQIAAEAKLSRSVELLQLGHGGSIEVCFARLCVGTKCFSETPILAIDSLGEPCMGRGLARALGVSRCVVEIGGVELRVSRLCSSPALYSYVALPERYVPKGARCVPASVAEENVVSALASYVARELASNLLTIKLAILASYAVITIPTSARLLRGLRRCIDSLRIVGVPASIARASTMITAAILALTAALLGVSVATVAIHAASSALRILGIYVVAKPLPSATSVATYLAYSAGATCASIAAAGRRL